MSSTGQTGGLNSVFTKDWVGSRETAAWPSALQKCTGLNLQHGGQWQRKRETEEGEKIGEGDWLVSEAGGKGG